MLESRNVFIDTQAFVQYRFLFHHPALKRLLELSSTGSMQLILTESIVGEVRIKLIEQLTEAEKSLRQLQKLVRVIENVLPNNYQGLKFKPNEKEFTSLADKV